MKTLGPEEVLATLEFLLSQFHQYNLLKVKFSPLIIQEYLLYNQPFRNPIVMVFTQDNLETYQELHLKNQSKLLENQGVVVEIFLSCIMCLMINLFQGFAW